MNYMTRRTPTTDVEPEEREVLRCAWESFLEEDERRWASVADPSLEDIAQCMARYRERMIVALVSSGLVQAADAPSLVDWYMRDHPNREYAVILLRRTAQALRGEMRREAGQRKGFLERIGLHLPRRVRPARGDSDR